MLSLADPGIVTRALVPPASLPLGGYTARNGGTPLPGGDELIVRAVRLRPGLVLATAEMLTAPEGLTAAVRERLPGIEVILVATHTHCAPDSQMLNPRMTIPIPGVATFRRRWLEWYADQIAAACRAALNLPSPERSVWVIRKVEVELSRKRRGDRALVRTPLWTLERNGRPVLIGHSAHPTLLGSEELHLRGDWPGEVARQTGALVVTGPLGDLSPVPPANGSPTTYAMTLVTALEMARPIARWSSVRASFRTLSLPPSTPHPEFASANQITPDLAEAVVRRFAPPDAEIVTLTVGGQEIVLVSGEPTFEFARKAFPGALVVSHSNGWCGYLLTPEDYSAGGYEAQLSFYGPEVLSVFQARYALRSLPSPQREAATPRAPATGASLTHTTLDPRS